MFSLFNLFVHCESKVKLSEYVRICEKKTEANDKKYSETCCVTGISP